MVTVRAPGSRTGSGSMPDTEISVPVVSARSLKECRGPTDRARPPPRTAEGTYTFAIGRCGPACFLPLCAYMSHDGRPRLARRIHACGGIIRYLRGLPSRPAAPCPRHSSPSRDLTDLPGAKDADRRRAPLLRHHRPRRLTNITRITPNIRLLLQRFRFKQFRAERCSYVCQDQFLCWETGSWVC